MNSVSSQSVPTQTSVQPARECRSFMVRSESERTLLGCKIISFGVANTVGYAA
jgi:hypothetical protein